MGKIIDWFKEAVTTCPTCHGAGVLPAGIEDHEAVKCPICHGEGVLAEEEVIQRTIETPCDNPACKQGKVLKKQMEQGVMKDIEEDCPVCNGLNRIVRQVDESYIGHRTCPACEGRGMVTGKELKRKHLERLCPDCKGTGKQVDTKRLVVLLPVALPILINPLMAFAGFALVGVLFSLYAVRTNKNKDIS